MNPFSTIEVLIEYVREMLEMRAFYNHLEEDMYKAHGVSPDTSNCLGHDGDYVCEKRKYCRRYTDEDYEHPINRLEYPGIYGSRCGYFTPNADGLKKYFEKTGEWRF